MACVARDFAGSIQSRAHATQGPSSAPPNGKHALCLTQTLNADLPRLKLVFVATKYLLLPRSPVPARHLEMKFDSCVVCEILTCICLRRHYFGQWMADVADEAWPTIRPCKQVFWAGQVRHLHQTLDIGQK